MAVGVAGGRVAIGVASLLAPGLVARTLTRGDGDGTRLFARMVGARDLGLGLGVLIALDRGAPVRGWLEASALVDGVDAVHDGGRFKPAAHGRAAVQGDQQSKSQAEVAGADHAGEEARPALGPVTAGHYAADQLRRQERHDADGDPPARQRDRQLPSLHRPDGTRSAIGR